MVRRTRPSGLPVSSRLRTYQNAPTASAGATTTSARRGGRAHRPERRAGDDPDAREEQAVRLQARDQRERGHPPGDVAGEREGHARHEAGGEREVDVGRVQRGRA